MNSTTIIIAIVAILLLVLLVAGAVAVGKRNRTEALRRQFGPEYDQAVSATGDRRAAESELAARRKRVAAFDIRPLPAQERDRYGRAWQIAQTQFVDEPSQAIVEADKLVNAVIQARGYPMGDFEQRAADLSVDHANVVNHYRAARDIAQSNATSGASTETLRQAMIHYRALFDDLLADSREPVQKELSK